MRHINWVRVFIGGIVAGLIIDVVQWLLNGVSLGPDWREAMQAGGLFGGEVESGVLHTQRLEDAFAEERLKRLARSTPNQDAHDCETRIRHFAERSSSRRRVQTR